MLVRDGRIIALGREIEVPPGTRVVDYGPTAVIVPGFVAADSTYGSSRAAPRTAEPGLLAVDGFDPYTTYGWALSGGVTAAYIAPARGRLIAGQGAVVKLGGRPDADRVLNASAALHGAVSAEARSTPGYWEPPVPATIDTGLGVAQPQLPKTVTGAIVALRELLELARTGEGSDEYGPYAGPGHAAVLDRSTPWRMGAQTSAEVRALLEFAPLLRQHLVIDGAQGAGDLAAELAAAGVDVIVDAPIRPNRTPRDYGKGAESVWPRYDVAARLAEAGCRFAIATPDSVSAHELLFAARAASRGGLDPEVALRAITLSPAEMLGVADRVGSLVPNKDADFVVLNGHPLSVGSGVLATWVGGELAWEVAASDASTASVVIAVENLHLGDGHVLSPGRVLIQNGRIVQVGTSVPVPPGASVVHGEAAMPGMIDALGHLGLEGSKKVPKTDFRMSRIIEPGDFADRRVAKAGVTTVALSPRSASKSGAPILAYKPASQGLDRQIVDDLAALRFRWADKNRTQSGNSVREVLGKTLKYVKDWKDYEEALAKWTPPAPKVEKDDDEDDDDEDAEKDDKDDDEKKSKKKSKKKKKDKPAKPVTGAWVAQVSSGDVEDSRMRLYILDEDGEVSGSLRCAALTDGLIDIEGLRDERDLTLEGQGSRGAIAISAEVEDPDGDGDDDEEGDPRLLKGTITIDGEEVEFEAEQTSTEYVIASRPVRKPAEVVKEKPVKGAPKAPRVDSSLEPLRRALEGQVAVIVEVDRADEIVACVDAFEEAGIKPILFGASDAYKVADQISGRVAGILLSHQIVRTSSRTGTQRTNRYAELSAAGIPVAFHSGAEEGAAELPMVAAYAVSQGMSASGALRALTSDAARMLAIEDRVGSIAAGMDGDVLLLDGDPFDPATSVVRVWVDGEEVQ
jgi:imidazolonepropionase-like amidohydrolase